MLTVIETLPSNMLHPEVLEILISKKQKIVPWTCLDLWEGTNNFEGSPQPSFQEMPLQMCVM